ncbi:hypothetical protein GOP47_0020971 [Adiantum capillus-veneris]|uniref:Uncharacterized protein n=1 Tax=Adiantum capillus-veneris TaxID=13818 RepID=A0A9D4Z975_ADICA|nr:hypothetical protein GOP47_0020971 [Adiantum capillus-veneris]
MPLSLPGSKFPSRGGALKLWRVSGRTVMMGGNGNQEKVASGGVVMGAAGRSPTTIRLPEAEGLVAVRGQVMTDEQMETLRRQISVYATICQQLVEMHKATMAQQHALSGTKFVC